MSDYHPPAEEPGPQPPAQPPGGTPPGYGDQGYGFPQYPEGGGNQLETSGAGFFAALFDFSFNHFVTPKIVKFVYVLATIALAITYVVFVIAGFTQGAGAGLFILVIGAMVMLVYLAFIRMTLEFYYAIVRMSQDINRRLPGA